MYEVDDRDEVIELQDAPRPDVGAPLPIVVSDEQSVLLAYILSEPDPNWDGTYVTVVSPTSEDEPIALVRFHRPYAHMFGPPNDEAFGGHPLAARGLQPYAVFEIQRSSWIRKLERMNSVHPYHRAERFNNYKHFIFAFHDSTFECIAEGFNYETRRSSIRSIREAMVASLGG